MQLDHLQNSLRAYRGVINDLSKTVKYVSTTIALYYTISYNWLPSLQLGSFSPPKSPLYIDYNEILAERKRRKVRSYFKYTTIILGISVFICLKCKWFF